MQNVTNGSPVFNVNFSSSRTAISILPKRFFPRQRSVCMAFGFSRDLPIPNTESLALAYPIAVSPVDSSDSLRPSFWENLASRATFKISSTFSFHETGSNLAKSFSSSFLIPGFRHHINLTGNFLRIIE